MGPDWWSLVLLAQEAKEVAGDNAGEQAAAPSLLNPLLPIIPIVLLAYFLLIRPEQRKAREKQDQLKSLKKNDRVLTIGGIHGVVVGISDDRVRLRVDDDKGVTLAFSKSAVAQVLSKDEPKGDTAAAKDGNASS